MQFQRNLFKSTFVILVSQKVEEASFHARVVLGRIAEIVTMGAIENVRFQLPADLRELFGVQNERELPGQGVIEITEM